MTTADEIRWLPGELEKRDLERIILDALTDLYIQCHNKSVFNEKVRELIRSATGQN